MANGNGHQQGDRDQEPNEGAPVVTEELEWRARALEAEAKARELEESLEACRSESAELRESLASVEGRREMERALLDEQAVDLESALLLTEAAVAEMEEPDVRAAVAELRRRKPFLFAGGRGSAAGAMSGSAGAPGSERGGELAKAAVDARLSGDRRALLRYLRLRRQAV